MGFRDYTEIIFEAGDILSVQMLEETYRYPREFLHLTHNNYCNGIICGLDFITKADGVYLTAGMVKINGKYYTLLQDVNMDEWLKQYKPSLKGQVEYCLCVTYEDILTDNDKLRGIKSYSRVTLKAEQKKPDNSLLLCKYKFRKDAGISLPILCEDGSEEPFEDFFRAGLLQLLECEYSHPMGKSTYHPLIFRAVQSYLEKKYPLSPYDFNLLMELQNRGIVAIKSLITYVAANKEISLTSHNMTREKLLREVAECIQKPYVPAIYTGTPSAINEPKKNKRQSKLI